MMKSTKSAIFPDQVSELEALIFKQKPIWQDAIFITGLCLTCLSALVFAFPKIAGSELDEAFGFGIFFFNYVVAVVYLGILLFSGLLKFKWTLTRNYTENIFLFLILSLISAFALNRQIPVFEKMADWLTVSLVILCFDLLALCFRKHLPKPILPVLYFILGISLVLYAYFSCYLIPYYPIGLVGAIFLGLSLHVFVPLFSFLFAGYHFYKAARHNRTIRIFGLAGLTIPFAVLVFFLLGWANVKNQINFAINRNQNREETLPAWMAVSRIIPPTPLAEKMIKTDLVYTTPQQGRWKFFDMPGRRINEVRRHDPLIMISCLLLGQPDLKENDRIKILESMYDSRHKTSERLWAGDALHTTNVISNIEVYPEYRLAYTEKTLSIRNQANSRWSRQEAIYTFHLPEGSVVTSLSLWINDREEKGILTTKAKADSAYKSIVGVEARDPSLVHWQEGNTVTVRVFPCTPLENRRFKIGITSPLHFRNDKLTYENIYFDGPEASGATETVEMHFTQSPQNLELPFRFKEKNIDSFVFNGSFRPYYEVSMQAPEVSGKAFTFQGKNYRAFPYIKSYNHFQPETIYLDLNASWNNEDLQAIKQIVKGRKVYIYNGKMVRVSDKNLETLYQELKQQNFSLFPFQLIRKPAKALVISKSHALSPYLKDLQQSRFGQELQTALQKPQKIRVFNLGTALSPYLKTLRELRTIAYDEGSPDDLKRLLQNQQFVQNQENDKVVILGDAALKISQTEGEMPSGGPDHLMRLFSYNHIMQQIGSNYFTENFITGHLLEEAQQAYVISPLSSLVVLETQQDYDRFNIAEAQNASLRNASIHGSGSVPEPHEWLLIFMVAAVVFYLYFRQKKLA